MSNDVADFPTDVQRPSMSETYKAMAAIKSSEYIRVSVLVINHGAMREVQLGAIEKSRQAAFVVTGKESKMAPSEIESSER
ncbi:hypothetical protein TNCV_2429621 [Trichonephila clavipes]|nr:hypothetical protein TNCV_2429621 [Trichonephila clavipes]